jgi:hypothetical protein
MMGLNIKDNLWKIGSKGLAPSQEKNIFMKDSGKMGKCMELAEVNGKMIITKQLLNMWGSILMALNKGLGNTLIVKEPCIRRYGLMGKLILMALFLWKILKRVFCFEILVASIF